MTNNKLDLVAPCGIYCGACPSLVLKRNNCLGCRSENRNQKRIAKWKCKIRQCCFEKKNIEFCFQCDEFPCNAFLKLKKSHPGDLRYSYRHEIIDNLKGIKELGIDKWIENQEKKWSCIKCGSQIVFYSYNCADCGHEHIAKDGIIMRYT